MFQARCLSLPVLVRLALVQCIIQGVNALEFRFGTVVQDGRPIELVLHANSGPEMISHLSQNLCSQFDSSRSSVGGFDLCESLLMLRDHELFLQSLGPNATFEGHSGQIPYQQRLYRAVASRPWVRTVCEIGFNAGHGALTWLTAPGPPPSNNNNTLRVRSFDLGVHTAARPALARLQALFGSERVQVVAWGDSAFTVPAALSAQTRHRRENGSTGGRDEDGGEGSGSGGSGTESVRHGGSAAAAEEPDAAAAAAATASARRSTPPPPPPPLCCDVVVVDGDHSYAGAMLDLIHSARLLEQCTPGRAPDGDHSNRASSSASSGASGGGGGSTSGEGSSGGDGSTSSGGGSSVVAPGPLPGCGLLLVDDVVPAEPMIEGVYELKSAVMLALEHAGQGRVIREFSRVGFVNDDEDASYALRGVAFAGSAAGCSTAQGVAWQRREVAAIRRSADDSTAAHRRQASRSASPSPPPPPSSSSDAMRQAQEEDPRFGVTPRQPWESSDADTSGCPLGCTATRGVDA